MWNLYLTFLHQKSRELFSTLLTESACVINSFQFSISCGSCRFFLSALEVEFHINIKAKYYKQTSAALWSVWTWVVLLPCIQIEINHLQASGYSFQPFLTAFPGSQVLSLSKCLKNLFQSFDPVSWWILDSGHIIQSPLNPFLLQIHFFCQGNYLGSKNNIACVCQNTCLA